MTETNSRADMDNVMDEAVQETERDDRTADPAAAGEEAAPEEPKEDLENGQQEHQEHQEADEAEKDLPSAEDKLRSELDETKDRYVRLLAEYNNYRKRTAKQMLESSASVRGDTIAQILPVFDNFERAANADSEDETYKAGVLMIFTQMADLLKKLGVEIIDPTGQTFDPNIANAVSKIEDPELGENIVAQTFQKGYKIGDKVIRYAMVSVANA